MNVLACAGIEGISQVEMVENADEESLDSLLMKVRKSHPDASALNMYAMIHIYRVYQCPDPVLKRILFSPTFHPNATSLACLDNLQQHSSEGVLDSLDVLLRQAVENGDDDMRRNLASFTAKYFPKATLEMAGKFVRGHPLSSDEKLAIFGAVLCTNVPVTDDEDQRDNTVGPVREQGRDASVLFLTPTVAAWQQDESDEVPLRRLRAKRARSEQESAANVEVSADLTASERQFIIDHASEVRVHKGRQVSHNWDEMVNLLQETFQRSFEKNAVKRFYQAAKTAGLLGDGP